MSHFLNDINKFNAMYGLPVSKSPRTDNLGAPLSQRLIDFKSILQEEVKEIDDIIQKAQCHAKGTMYCPPKGGKPYVPTEIEILTDVADWLGDIQVYCASEMAKYGLNNDVVLNIIMQSNFSKLAADGKPIYDERGKVMKGPGYWKPEPALEKMILVEIGNAAMVQIAPNASEPQALGAFDPLP